EHEVEGALVAHEVVDVDDAFVIEPAEDLGLALELGGEGGAGGDGRLERPDEHGAAERALLGAVGDGERARGHRLEDGVGPDLAGGTALCHVAQRTRSEWPVIASGFGMPRTSSSVGATSQMRPPPASETLGAALK